MAASVPDSLPPMTTTRRPSSASRVNASKTFAAVSAPGTGGAIVAGGRYDNLINDFGKAIPATGFAVYVDALVSCLPPREETVAETLIYYKSGCLGRALETLGTLPAGSAELSTDETESGSLDMALRRGFKKLLIVSKTGALEVKLNG